MRVKKLSAAVVAIALGTSTFTSQASNDAGHVWMPKQPSNQYWQDPNWADRNAQRPADSAPPPPPANRPRYQSYSYPAPNANRSAPPPPTGPYSGTPAPAPRASAPAQRPIQRPIQRPVQGPVQGRSQGPGPYRGAPAPRGAYDGPSAFYTPGYNPYRDRGKRNSRWGSNKFWGDSGPSKWMNPNKRNWENSWDDMINAPSRVGEMPGGWTAPEVSVPNPIDMGDQVQDNVQDLPDQMRDGNIGNDVSN